MRENRQYGSEGGGTELNRFSLPLSEVELLKLFFRDSLAPGHRDGHDHSPSSQPRSGDDS